MNQQNIGSFISKKRREKNLTQEQLAEKLGVSHKTVSKWETGKCMPDYSIIEPLCESLEISISELIDGEEKGDKSFRLYDNDQTIYLLEKTKKLENSLSFYESALGFLFCNLISSGTNSLGNSVIEKVVYVAINGICILGKTVFIIEMFKAMLNKTKQIKTFFDKEKTNL